jgi:hypothetical protein
MALAIDGATLAGGQATAGSTITSAAGAGGLTTENAGDIIVICVLVENINASGVYPTSTSVTVGGNAATLRNRFQYQGNATFGAGGAAFNTVEIWWLYSASALSSATVSVTLSGTWDDAAVRFYPLVGPQDAIRVCVNDDALTIDVGDARSAILVRDGHIPRNDLAGRDGARGARERASLRGRPIRRPAGGAWLPQRGRASWPHQAANRPASRSTNRSANRSANRSTNRSANRPANRSTNRPIALLQDAICI